MSTTTKLQFSLFVNGALADPDANAVTIVAPGITTNAEPPVQVYPMPPGPIAMTRQSTGVYYFNVTDPALGLVYLWSASWARYSVPQTIQYSTPGTPLVNPTGWYCDYSNDLINWFNSTNIAVFSDTNNTGEFAPTVAQYWINQTDGMIDNQLYHSNSVTCNGTVFPFPVIPLPKNDPDFIRFNQAATQWCGASMYMNRGIQDKGSDPDGQFQKHLDNAESVIGALIMRRQQENTGILAYPGYRALQPYPKPPAIAPNGQIVGGGWGGGWGW